MSHTPCFKTSPLSRAPAFRGTALACLTAILGCILGGLPLQAQSTSLISNPGFTLDENLDEWPDGWSKGKGITWHQEAAPELSYLRLKTEEPGQKVVLYKAIKLSAAVRTLDYVIQARAFDVVGGDESWHDARVILEFRDANNVKVAPVPPALIVSRAGSAPDWKRFSGQLEVPAGAVNLVIVGALFYCQSGTLDFGRVELKTLE